MIKDSYSKANRTIVERIGRNDSFFEITLSDGSVMNETEYTWNEISKEQHVKFGMGFKTVRLCTLPVSKIKLVHGILNTEIQVAEGQQVYQFLRGMTSFLPTGEKKDAMLGRGIGLVEGERIVEERFLSGVTNEITGFKL